jgi:hypothetical protein
VRRPYLCVPIGARGYEKPMSIISVGLYFVFASWAATWALMLVFVAVILAIGAVINGFLSVGKLFGGKR